MSVSLTLNSHAPSERRACKHNITICNVIEHHTSSSDVSICVYLIRGLQKEELVLLTHGDSVDKVADGFKVVARSGNIIAGEQNVRWVVALNNMIKNRWWSYTHMQVPNKPLYLFVFLRKPLTVYVFTSDTLLSVLFFQIYLKS